VLATGIFENVTEAEVQHKELIEGYPSTIDGKRRAMELIGAFSGMLWGTARHFAGYVKHIQSVGTFGNAIKFSLLGGLKNGVYVMVPFFVSRYPTFIDYEDRKKLYCRRILMHLCVFRNFMIARDQVIQLLAFQAFWLLSSRSAPFMIAPTLFALAWGSRMFLS
jgi:hypothetical protein